MKQFNAKLKLKLGKPNSWDLGYFQRLEQNQHYPRTPCVFQIFKYLFPNLNRVGLAGSYSLAGNNLISKPIVY